MRILVAEDEVRLADLLQQILTEAGHQPTVVHDGLSALAQARTGGFDVLLVDWMLPGLHGPAVLARLRSEGHDTPALVLTARGAVEDRISGLDAGADDYLGKPFEVSELLARLRALRRRRRTVAVATTQAGDLILDPGARTVRRAGHMIQVSAREYDILALLLAQAGQCVTRYTILDKVWDGQTDLRSNTIDVHVKSLRDKIDRPFERQAIQTVRGVGYRLDPTGG
jgi:two-component system OmpR family response regulator